jgi:hypothetical protein
MGQSSAVAASPRGRRPAERLGYPGSSELPFWVSRARLQKGSNRLQLNSADLSQVNPRAEFSQYQYVVDVLEPDTNCYRLTRMSSPDPLFPVLRLYLLEQYENVHKKYDYDKYYPNAYMDR